MRSMEASTRMEVGFMRKRSIVACSTRRARSHIALPSSAGILQSRSTSSLCSYRRSWRQAGRGFSFRIPHGPVALGRVQSLDVIAL